MTPVEEIAGKLTEATRPDRELDAAIGVVAGLRVVDEGHPLGLQCYTARGQSVPLPRYTSSLDAAMSLVPEGFHTELAMQDRHSLRWKWSLRGGFGVRHDARAGTAALALCAAALHARAHLQTPSTEKGE